MVYACTTVVEVWPSLLVPQVDQPPCDICGGQASHAGMSAPTPAEAADGAARVEVYHCSQCEQVRIGISQPSSCIVCIMLPSRLMWRLFLAGCLQQCMTRCLRHLGVHQL
eukprot:GHUV01045045.1.p1 GENE.GHUV01045045.1~~GHUV01045045.1.p1  ORF type:complete len:110 (-),score=22.21 GHUV01045045.1:235-564(-)